MTNPLIALIEKTFWTYVQVFVTAWLAADTLGASTAQAAAIAAIPAGLTVVANGIPLVPEGLPFYTDLAFRLVRTYVVTFLGFVISVPVFSLDYSIAVSASVAGITAAMAVLKGAAASRIGDHSTAAALPSSLDASAA